MNLKLRFPLINQTKMPYISPVFNLYKDNQILRNKAEEVVTAIVSEHPEFFPPEFDTWAKKFRTCPEWAMKRPYFLDPTIPVVTIRYKTVKASEIKDNLLIQNNKWAGIQDAANRHDTKAVRESCLNAIALFDNGREFDYQNGEELAIVTDTLNTLLTNNLIDETIKNQVLDLGIEQVTNYISWTDQFNEGKPDSEKLFFHTDPENPSANPFDLEITQFKLYWYPVEV